MTELTTFDFHGDQLDVVREGEKVWIGVRRICDALGIDDATQKEKLKTKGWATYGLIPSVAADGRMRDVFCIEHRSLPMWLATIDAERVSASVREKLAVYQKECADVLADHFLGKRGSDSRVVEILSARLAAMEAQLYALTCRTVEAAKPSIGPGAARTYVLDPLREIARVRARALKQTSPRTIQSLRASAERALRRELAFPPDRNMRWELFPASRLGEACCVIARMHGDAQELARVAAGPAKQTKLALIRA